VAKKLFVGGLSWGTTDNKLSEFFSQAGTVVSAVVITDRFSGKSKGFGFVEMSTDEEAETAKRTLNGQELDGRKIAVDDARPQQPREGGFVQRREMSRGRDRRRNY
jgi:RNA recognition motif-containing protein